jgi:tRNA1(Val) A37 N6-methylase TrmN6
MHGLIQSQAHAKAARMLSAARAAQRMGLPGADELVTYEKANYRKALQEYIDPFKIHRVW